MDSSFAGNPSSLLNVHSRMQFTGRLYVQADGHQWSLYLYLGRLIWATGGPHPVRRWYRHITQCCPQINPQSLPFAELNSVRCWDYYALTELVKLQHITVEQSVALIRGVVTEVVFDIIQLEETKLVSCKSDLQDVLGTSLTVVNVEQTLGEVQPIWNDWRSLGLADHSPNLAPVLRQVEQLQLQTSDKVYRTLVSLIDGKRNLREIAVSVKQDVLSLTRMLVPFFRKGFVGLVQIPDLPSPIPKIALSSSPLPTPSAAPKPIPVTGPLIGCIDDSPRECEVMEEILSMAGYRFIGIQDSVQALPILLEKKPRLIFLDLVMPVASGYEICAQLRRVSVFRETPIVILTNNDGIIDRVRAKVVGCSDFISKPVTSEKVLTVIRKFLSAG